MDSTGDGDDDGSDVNVKMEKLMPIFIQQLKMLLGFPDNVSYGCFVSVTFTYLYAYIIVTLISVISL